MDGKTREFIDRAERMQQGDFPGVSPEVAEDPFAREPLLFEEELPEEEDLPGAVSGEIDSELSAFADEQAASPEGEEEEEGSPEGAAPPEGEDSGQ